MQKFPKTLRFYYKTRAGYYYTFNKPDFLNHNNTTERLLNGILTDEQKYQVQQVLTHNKGVIHMGTGKGKSRVIYDSVCKLGNQYKYIILTHNIQTAKDMYKGFVEHTNIPEKLIGLTCSGSKHQATQETQVHIMTHTSFKKTRKQIQQHHYDFIFYDECDFHLSFPKGQDYDCMTTALIYHENKGMYGLTGTPYRADGGQEALERVFGPIRTYQKGNSSNSSNMSNNEQTQQTQQTSLLNIQEERKYYYTPKIIQCDYYLEQDYVIEDRHELVKELVDDSYRLTEQIDFITNHSRKRNLILVKSVQESFNIFAKLQEKLENTTILNGTLSNNQEQETIRWIKEMIDTDSGFTIVGTIDKIGRGVDIPPIDTLFLFSPVRFQGTVVQAVGRALRKCPGKEDVYIYDWCDLPILRKQKRERAAAYRSEYGVSTSECPIN